MAKVKFTIGRVDGFNCETTKIPSFLWDAVQPGLGLRATPNGSKAYIFQAKLKGQVIRMTIGDTLTWSIDEAQREAAKLRMLINEGKDPRQVRADGLAAEQAQRSAKEAADKTAFEIKTAQTAAQEAKRLSESIMVKDAWKVYVNERSTSIKKGKSEWGDKHRAQHAYFVEAGGMKRTRGRRSNESETTRTGILVPLMNLRLVDLDDKAVSVWLDKENARAPTMAALAFRLLRAFIAWCTKNKTYQSLVHADACLSDCVKKKVQAPQVKKNDNLRRAQLRPWFEAVQQIRNPVISAYLQCLLLTGARRNEMATLRWDDVDFKWKSLTIRDKVEGERTIPLTPFVEHLITPLPRRNEFVFSSPTAASGRLEEPRIPHNKALAIAALPALSLHGLRRSFGTLSEWVEVPAGISAQIMGHKPSAIAEKHYIQRELDLLYIWHVKIESWILEQANVLFEPIEPGLRIVAA